MTDDFLDWHDTVERHLSGELNEDETAAFVERLDSDREARQYFVEWCEMDVELGAAFEGVAEPIAFDRPVSEPCPYSRPHPVLTWLPWGIAAALVFAFLLPRDNDGDDGAAVASVVALQVEADGALFADGRDAGDVKFDSGSYELTQGVVHLRFSSGADVVVEAPASFQLDDAMRMQLSSGKLRAVVPPAARGFVVATEFVDFQDIGTEFGVAVSRDGGISEMSVFKGQVNVISKDGQTVLGEIIAGQGVRCVKAQVQRGDAAESGTFPVHAGVGRLVRSVAINEDTWFIRATSDVGEVSGDNAGSVGGPLLGGASAPSSRQPEKTEPPADILTAKVMWGESGTVADTAGESMAITDWNLVGGDVDRMVEQARSAGLPGQATTVDLVDFDFDPDATPSLLFSGARTFKLPAKERARLREYVLKGGTVVIDSVYGSPYFTRSARSIMESIFPDSRFRTLPTDHPLYHMYHGIETVNFPENAAQTKPQLEAIYVGSRAAVILSPQGLGTGWDGDQTIFPKLKERGLSPQYYSVESSRQIAANLSSYITGYLDVGVLVGTPELFGLADENRPTDEFVFAQITHDGAWNVHPGAAPSLLVDMRSRTALRLNLKRLAVDPSKDDLAAFPFLYLTGLDDFTFSDDAVAALRTFFSNGGKMLINNGLGLQTFDAAVRRELARVLPQRSLADIPAGHDIFRTLQPIQSVRYTPALVKAEPTLGDKPVLQGIANDGELQVIYSPYDLEGGWLNVNYPLSRGYQPDSARKLGMNVIAYILAN